MQPITSPPSRQFDRKALPLPQHVLLAITVIVGLGMQFGSRFADGQTQQFTYSYSNLLDGGLSLEPSFREYDMLIAVEEALALWASHAPLRFDEVPDSGPEVSDEIYSAAGHPQIRIGHYSFDNNILGRAYLPNSFDGRSQDVHLDDSDRTWSESLFFTTVAHELGHALDLDHFDEETALMNTQLGGTNLLHAPGESVLWQPDIEAIQAKWGIGNGEVRTQRTWSDESGDRWDHHANWREGWQPTRFADVLLGTSQSIYVTQPVATARSIAFGAGAARLHIRSGVEVRVHENVTLGQIAGGDAMVPVGATSRYLVPQGTQAGWYDPDFDDSMWRVGTTAFGYERNSGYEDQIVTDILADMYGQQTSFFSRYEFNVVDPEQISHLMLNMKFDDGFVAYLNGTRIAAMNQPPTLSWNSKAARSRNDQDAISFESFDLVDNLDLLRTGRNVLAIHGLNSRTTSSDLLITPELRSGNLNHELLVDGGQLMIDQNLRLGNAARSQSALRILNGTARIGGNITIGQGQGTVELRGGSLMVEGGFDRRVLLNAESTASVLVPTDGSLADDWIDVNFDDSGWAMGPASFGYERSQGFEDLIATDLEAQMFDRNASFLTRIEFERAALETADELLLNLKYDDGFIAFLNGQEVARDNAPNNVMWNSTATQQTKESRATEFRTFDISDHADQLLDGRNVLAIQGLNSSANNSDLLLVAELVSRQLAGDLQVDEVEFYGGEIRGLARLQGTFEHRDGEFSPSARSLNRHASAEFNIQGAYRMQPEAVLRIDFDPNGTHDVLHVSAAMEVAGTLALLAKQAHTDPTVPTSGSRESIKQIVAADEVSGTFESLLLNGETWLPGHQQSGFFRFIDYAPNGISIRSLQALPGDANGDGVFNSDDIVHVFIPGEFEDHISDNSTWVTGDWDGDLDFTSEDLVTAFRLGHYQIAAARVIPEPNGAILLALGWLISTSAQMQSRHVRRLNVR